MPLKQVMLLDLIYCSFFYLYCLELRKFSVFCLRLFCRISVGVVPVHIALHIRSLPVTCIRSSLLVASNAGQMYYKVVCYRKSEDVTSCLDGLHLQIFL